MNWQVITYPGDGMEMRPTGFGRVNLNSGILTCAMCARGKGVDGCGGVELAMYGLVRTAEAVTR